MSSYKIIEPNDSENVALFFEEHFIENDKEYFIDPYLNKAVYSNISQIRDLLFKSKLYGMLECSENIFNYVFFDIPVSDLAHWKFATMIAAKYNNIDLIRRSIGVLKSEFYKEFNKIKINYLLSYDTYDKFSQMCTALHFRKNGELETSISKRMFYSLDL